MRKLILASAMLAAATLSGTAHAQYRGDYSSQYRNYNGDQRLQRLQWRLDRVASTGQLSHWEVRDLRRQLADLYRLEDRLEDGGFTRWEREVFQRRTDAFEQRLRSARFASNGRNVGYHDSRYGNDHDWSDRRNRDRDDDDDDDD